MAQYMLDINTKDHAMQKAIKDNLVNNLEILLHRVKNDVHPVQQKGNVDGFVAMQALEQLQMVCKDVSTAYAENGFADKYRVMDLIGRFVNSYILEFV